MDIIFHKISAPSEEIAIEFLQHLQNGQSLVRGRRITISDTVIAKVSGLLVEGTIWPKKHVMLQDMRHFQRCR